MANIIYRNQANKIYIYNSADEAVNTEELAEQKSTSSITILTPEYHIRIKNNNFKSEAKKNNNEDFEESELKKMPTDPKSCSIDSKLAPNNNLFSMNEDVLLKSIDDKLYLGTIVNIKNGKYLVKFDDNTEKWSCERGLQKLNSSLKKSYNDDDPLCVVCKAKSETDVVEVCNFCSRGFHRHCTQQDSSNLSSPWCCDRCTAQEIISIPSDSELEESDKSNLSEDVSNFLDLFSTQYLSMFLSRFRSRSINGIHIQKKTRLKIAQRLKGKSHRKSAKKNLKSLNSRLTILPTKVQARAR